MDDKDRFWLGKRLVTDGEYRSRVMEIKARALSLCLSNAWIARQIGRSRTHVQQVLGLNERRGRLVRGPGTVLLIEQLLDRVARGEITPGHDRGDSLLPGESGRSSHPLNGHPALSKNGVGCKA